MAFPATPVNGQIYTTADGRKYVYSLIRDSWEFDKNAVGFKNNISATVDPSLNDGASAGYSVGSIWVNNTTKKAFINVSDTIGAAVWEANGGSNTTVSSSYPTSPVNGQLFYNTINDKVYIWNGTFWVDIVAGGMPAPKHNVAATDPTNNDDITAGYSIGSMWINTTTNTPFINVDNTATTSIWNQLPSAVSNNPTWTTINTASYNVTSGDHLFVDTTTTPVTIVLPASPLANDTVSIVDVSSNFAINNCTVARNTKLIMGLASDLILSANNIKTTLTYVGTDWRITA